MRSQRQGCHPGARALGAAGGRPGFTLIELLVVIAIIAVLAAILFPVFGQARAKARQAACQSNLHQIGTAIQMYVQDFDESYPMSGYIVPCPWPELCGTDLRNITWVYLVQPYSKNNLYSRCPDAEPAKDTPLGKIMQREGRIGYGIAYPVPGLNGLNFLTRIDNSANHVLVMDVIPDGTSSQVQLKADGAYQPQVITPFALTAYPGASGGVQGSHQRPQGRHAGNVDVLFCDGHVKALPFDRVYAVSETICSAGNGQGCNNFALSSTDPAYRELWELWK